MKMFKIIFIATMLVLVPALLLAGEDVSAEVSLCPKYSPFDMIVLTVKIRNWSGEDMALAKNFAYGPPYSVCGLNLELEQVGGTKKETARWGFPKEESLSFFILPAGKYTSYLVNIHDIDEFERILSKQLESLPCRFRLTVTLFHRMPTAGHREKYEEFAQANNAITWEGEAKVRPVEFEITRPVSADDLHLHEEIAPYYKRKMKEWGEDAGSAPRLSYKWAHLVVWENLQEKDERVLPGSKAWDYWFARMYMGAGGRPLKKAMDDGIYFGIEGFQDFDVTCPLEERRKWFLEYFKKMKETRGNSPPFEPLIRQMEWLEVVVLYRSGRIEEADALRDRILQSEPDNCFFFELKCIKRYREDALEQRRRDEFHKALEKSRRENNSAKPGPNGTETNAGSTTRTNGSPGVSEENRATPAGATHPNNKPLDKPSISTTTNIILVVAVLLLAGVMVAFLILRRSKSA
jgi:hypothetical protein